VKKDKYGHEKLTKKGLESAIKYFESFEPPPHSGIDDLLYYRPCDLERLGLTVKDVIKILEEK